jgi:micrococcal nuclease
LPGIRHPIAYSLLAACLALAACSTPRAAGIIRHVEAGDTFTLASGEKIRVVGVDTPDMPPNCRCETECRVAREATIYTREALAGRFAIDRQNDDGAGHTLALVRIEGRNLADMLIGAGLGRPHQEVRRQNWC